MDVSCEGDTANGSVDSGNPLTTYADEVSDTISGALTDLPLALKHVIDYDLPF